MSDLPAWLMAVRQQQANNRPAWERTPEAQPGYRPPRPLPRQMRPLEQRLYDQNAGVRAQAVRQARQRRTLDELPQRAAGGYSGYADRNQVEEFGRDLTEMTGAPAWARGIRNVQHGRPGEAIPDFLVGAMNTTGLATLPLGGGARAASTRAPMGMPPRPPPPRMPPTRIYRGINHEHDPTRSAALGDRWWHTNPEVASTYAPGSDGAHVVPGLLDENALNLAHIETPPGTMWRAIPVESLPSNIRRAFPRGTTHVTTQEVTSAAETAGYDGVTFTGMRDSGFANAIEGAYPGFGTGDDGRVVFVARDNVVRSPFPESPLPQRPLTTQSPDAGQSGAGQTGGFTAYHGSPHEFDSFDTAYAQTGEGANVQGRGLYFAEREDVAGAYRFNNVQEGQTPMGVARDILGDTRGNYDEAIEQVRDGLRSDPQRPLWSEALEILERREVPTGNVYRAHINADPATLLDLDAPLSRQPEAVRRLIGRRLRSNATGQEVFNDIRQRYGENAEQILRMEGVPGIKYLDQGSRGVGAGTRNYVMFDHGDIQIMERNGVPVRPTRRQANAPDGGASGAGNRVVYRGLNRPYDPANGGYYQSFTSSLDDAREYGPNVIAAHINPGRNLAIDGGGNNFNALSVEQLPADVRARLHPSVGASATTDQIAHAAREAGYDSVTVRNVHDNRWGERPARGAEPRTIDFVFDTRNISPLDSVPEQPTTAAQAAERVRLSDADRALLDELEADLRAPDAPNESPIQPKPGPRKPPVFPGRRNR